MKDILVIGAGGFGREVKWMIDRINNANGASKWNVAGFIDDGIDYGTRIEGIPVLGGIEFLDNSPKEISVVCAIANTVIRKRIINRIKNNKKLLFPNLLDPQIIISPDCTIGEGNVICASTVVSVNVSLGDFDIIDWSCTVGHDVVLHDYVTLFPSVNVSGCVEIRECSEIGTGAQIIQGKKIESNTIIGAGTVVIRDIVQGGTYVGVPAEKT